MERKKNRITSVALDWDWIHMHVLLWKDAALERGLMSDTGALESFLT